MLLSAFCDDVLLQMVKPLLEPKTYNKVKFVYSDDANSKKIMEDLFDMDSLESAFGGKDNNGFDITKYAERMKEDDKKIPSFWSRSDSPSSVPQNVPPPPLDSIKLDSDSDASDKETKEDRNATATEKDTNPDHNPASQEDRNATATETKTDTNPDHNLVSQEDRNVAAGVHFEMTVSEPF